VQKAGVAALNGPQDGVKVMLDEYRRRRDALHGWLTANPAIKCVKPRGAFYLFPDISELLGGEVKTSSEFAQRLIEQEHVALTPGEGFDAPGYLRISYATSMEQLREGGDADPEAGGEYSAQSERRSLTTGHGDTKTPSETGTINLRGLRASVVRDVNGASISYEHRFRTEGNRRT